MHEAIVRDAEFAPRVCDAVGRLVIDSREDATKRSATLKTLVGTDRKLMSQLVASQRNQIDQARVIALSQRITPSQVEKTNGSTTRSSVDNTSQSWER
jgi:hypothetical protein